MSEANSSIAVMLVLMLAYAGQASASFKDCFKICALGCVISPNKPACIVKCIAKCIILPPSATGLDYCKLGCAVDQCTVFQSDSNKVDDCVTKCETGKCSLFRLETAASPVSTSPEKSSPSPSRTPAPSSTGQ
ncbi:protein TAP1-like [Sesamum indicum]|uniref:Protein TAP1-like n=1 Tax=Sesamum indicum TaxID=4182 RepID=A0A6I9SR27_SESIN|nr:protein TAP1-like [Sesamum indicum]